MPSWKKMAEAFGRAMTERMTNGKAAKAINASEIADKANTPYLYKDKDMDAIRAYRHGQAEGAENYRMGLTRAQAASGKASPRRSDISRAISRVEDENSSWRLQNERAGQTAPADATGTKAPADSDAELKQFDDALKETESRYKGETPDHNIPPEAKKLYEAYDLEYARRHGPDAAYERARIMSGLDDDFDIPSNRYEFEETYGFDIEDGFPE